MKKTFKELTNNIDMILFNKIIEIDFELELEAWREYNLYSELYSKQGFEESKENWDIPEDAEYEDESDELVDIYQYFAISRMSWEYLSKITWMPLFYSNKCDLFILWINFLDNWQNMSYEI